MPLPDQQPSPSDSTDGPDLGGDASTPDPDGISLDQLSEAFAEMLRTGQAPRLSSDGTDRATASVTGSNGVRDEEGATDLGDVTPRNLLEAMLFVGSPTNQPLATNQVIALLRGVPPGEVNRLVRELNEIYAQDGSPYEIVSHGPGYQLALRKALEPIRDRFHGRARQARLSRAAIEVLAVVAYRGPIAADQVNRLRGTSSGHVLTQLVRRRLLRIERPEGSPRSPVYLTTDRFLHLFGLETLEDLPKSEELIPE